MVKQSWTSSMPMSFGRDARHVHRLLAARALVVSFVWSSGSFEMSATTWPKPDELDRVLLVDAELLETFLRRDDDRRRRRRRPSSSRRS